MQHGVRVGSNCFVAWVPEDLNWSDALTKAGTEASRAMAECRERRAGIIRFDGQFSTREHQPLRREKEKLEANAGVHLAAPPEMSQASEAATFVHPGASITRRSW